MWSFSAFVVGTVALVCMGRDISIGSMPSARSVVLDS